MKKMILILFTLIAHAFAKENKIVSDYQNYITGFSDKIAACNEQNNHLFKNTYKLKDQASTLEDDIEIKLSKERILDIVKQYSPQKEIGDIYMESKIALIKNCNAKNVEQLLEILNKMPDCANEFERLYFFTGISYKAKIENWSQEDKKIIREKYLSYIDEMLINKKSPILSYLISLSVIKTMSNSGIFEKSKENDIEKLRASSEKKWEQSRNKINPEWKKKFTCESYTKIQNIEIKARDEIQKDLAKIVKVL